mmetsp:Transcript_18625/g.44147  ORF Transcript_18625/g.44147 Transcript_18625/m.44147 type:complete len:119 (-) Transcript_18625:356-712(-)
MKTAVCTTLALVAASASAFVVPATSGPQSASATALRAEAEKTELLVDENFDGVNLVGLMGLNRLKKISRRHNRKLSDRIRNFEVVQDGEDYVPATADQTEQMRAAAGSSPAPAAAAEE